MSKNPVVHFEMGYKNEARMIKFYETVFGWETKQMGPQMGNYVLANTTETDKDGMVKTPGTINGGFYDKTQDPQAAAPSVVIRVSDIHAAMKAVEANGGKIAGVLDPEGKKTMEPQEIPGVGLWMAIIDSEGNRLSLLQPPA